MASNRGTAPVSSSRAVVAVAMLCLLLSAGCFVLATSEFDNAYRHTYQWLEFNEQVLSIDGESAVIQVDGTDLELPDIGDEPRVFVIEHSDLTPDNGAAFAAYLLDNRSTRRARVALMKGDECVLFTIAGEVLPLEGDFEVRGSTC